MKRIFWVAILGLLLAISGGYLRFNVHNLLPSSAGTEPLTYSTDASVGFKILNHEEESEPAALVDLSMVMLYSGSALIVISVAAPLFGTSRRTEH